MTQSRQNRCEIVDPPMFRILPLFHANDVDDVDDDRHSGRGNTHDPVRAASGWNGGPAPQWEQGDAMRSEDDIKVANGAIAILHGVDPPGYRNWDRTVLPMIDNTIAAAKAAGGARVVLPGTIYNYDAAP